MKELKKISTVLLLLTITVFSTACAMRINKHYDYKKAEHDFQSLSIRARLIGSFNSTEKVTEKESPYELLISFSFTSPNVKGSTVGISEIKLSGALDDEIAFEAETPLKQEVEKGSDGVHRAYFSAKSLSLEYVRYRLTLKFKVNVKGEISEESTELYFDKDYKEFKSNDLWDRVMSI
jgi:hypothetical protein